MSALIGIIAATKEVVLILRIRDLDVLHICIITIKRYAEHLVPA